MLGAPLAAPASDEAGYIDFSPFCFLSTCSRAARYVDDYFAVDVAAEADHSMQMFVRMVRSLLGHDAINEAKVEQGMPLEILGVDVAVSNEGIRLTVGTAKRKRWSDNVDQALQVGKLTHGEASKLAGRLSWASQACFKK